jgi:hypothetical protein
MTAYEYLTQCVMTRLQPSSIHGIGVFAIRDIKAGDNVFEVWLGQTGTYELTKTQYDSLSKELQDYLCAMFGYPYKIKLTNGCHFIFITPQYFINTKFEEGTVDCFTYTALIDIPKGMELYSTYGRNHKHEYKSQKALI